MKLLAAQAVGPRKPARRAPSPAYWLARAQTAASNCDVGLAHYCYARALAQRGDWGQAHFEYGHFLQQQASEASLLAAASHYRLALCVAPTLLAAAYNLGIVSLALGHLSDARDGLTAALADPALRVQAHRALGCVYEALATLAPARDDNATQQQALRHFAVAKRLQALQAHPVSPTR